MGRYRPRYYRRDGSPYPEDPNDAFAACLAWAKDFESDRRVDQTDIELPRSWRMVRDGLWVVACAWKYLMTWDKMPRRPTRGVRVSTIFLGLDHSFFEGPPLIFETMIFGEHDARDYACWRYSTEEEALQGHRWACHLVKSGYYIDEYPY